MSDYKNQFNTIMYRDHLKKTTRYLILLKRNICILYNLQYDVIECIHLIYRV